MNCLNCGAPLELADGRTVLKCGHCHTMRRMEFTGDDGDRVISLQRPSERDCPRCQLEMVQASLDGQAVDHCQQCGGILVESDVFAEVTWNRRAAYRGAELAPQPYDPDAFNKIIDCPQCQGRMEVHAHCGAGRAVIDSCARCHLVWLDNSEMTSIERTPGRRG